MIRWTRRLHRRARARVRSNVIETELERESRFKTVNLITESRRRARDSAPARDIRSRDVRAWNGDRGMSTQFLWV